MRTGGQELLTHPELDLWMTERATREAAHVFDRRLQVHLERNRISPVDRSEAPIDFRRFLDGYVTVVPDTSYLASVGREAALRVPDDPDDQPTAALALVTGVAIWTEDTHFWGCGLSAWRTDRLRAVVTKSQ